MSLQPNEAGHITDVNPLHPKNMGLASSDYTSTSMPFIGLRDPNALQNQLLKLVSPHFHKQSGEDDILRIPTYEEMRRSSESDQTLGIPSSHGYSFSSSSSDMLKRDASANASADVKHKLQNYLLNKQRQKQQEMSCKSAFYLSGGQPSSISTSHNQEYPLRKTSSEPNLKAKSKIKQKVAGCRSSPLTARPPAHPLCKKTLSSDYANPRIYRAGSPLSDGGSPSSTSCHHSPVDQKLSDEDYHANNDHMTSQNENIRHSANVISKHNVKPHPPLKRSVPLRPPALIPASSSLATVSSSASLAPVATAATQLPGQSQTLSSLLYFPLIRHNGVDVTHDNPNILDIASQGSFAPTQKGLGVQVLQDKLRRKQRNQVTTLSEAKQEHKILQKNLLHHEQAVIRFTQDYQRRYNAERKQQIDTINEAILESQDEESPKSQSNYQKLLHQSRMYLRHSEDNILQAQLHEPTQLSLTNSVSNVAEQSGIVYDIAMVRHQCLCGNNTYHAENPARVQNIWMRFLELGFMHHCKVLNGVEIELDDIEAVHSSQHTSLYATDQLSQKNISKELQLQRLNLLPCGGLGIDTDTIWNDLHSRKACVIAAGSLVSLCEAVANRELRNGFALIRPPGHHAEKNQALGFCYLNNVAIAAKRLHRKGLAKKILILDWDVHHGNGTQQAFYDNPNVLYISLHRYDNGGFFPGSGSPDQIGEGDGSGFNINIGFSSPPEIAMSDKDYMAAFRSLVIPITKQFNPDFVLVSAGFDAAQGHAKPIGGYEISPACFGWMTSQLMELMNGRIVLSLEGGYELEVLTECAVVCMSALLNFQIPPIKHSELTTPPSKEAVLSLEKTFQQAVHYYPTLREYHNQIHMSHVQAMSHALDRTQEMCGGMASLSVDCESMDCSQQNGVEEEILVD